MFDLDCKQGTHGYMFLLLLWTLGRLSESSKDLTS
jgi:hypothetical protein